MRGYIRIIAGFFSVVIMIYSVSAPFAASATLSDAFYYGADTFLNWIRGNNSEPLGGWTFVDWASALFSSNKPQAYYTTPSESVEDEHGNVTNYYREGDTTTTQILDSYNHTFSTIHNVSNTNSYDANIALENFLNSYTTNTNNYTYNTDYKSWYYDATSQTYNYDASSTYYNTDNSQYYISIDNSTDEYYLVDIQYSPTYVTVNYTYNNIDNSVHYGNVTNVYYYELSDGRNSAALTADDVLGMDLGYDVAGYEAITDDPYTLSLQHFDSDYSDSSVFNHFFYSENRSTTYVDAGAFGKAVKLFNGAAAGVYISDLRSYDGLTIDFRIYYDKIDSLGVYFGDTCLFGPIPDTVTATFYDYYDDHESTYEVTTYPDDFVVGEKYNTGNFFPTSSRSLSELHTVPKSLSDMGVSFTGTKYGYLNYSCAPSLSESSVEDFWTCTAGKTTSGSNSCLWSFEHSHYKAHSYSWTAKKYVSADFSYAGYANQWISMRITLSKGFLYFFVNGDLVGSGDFSVPSADKFYIKSSGILYLDELRISTGDMVYTKPYVPSSAPYDTNKVLALPSAMESDTIYVRSSIPVSVWRVGGVRPSNPSRGFFYLPIHSDNTGGQSQIYDGNNWINVDSVIFDGSTTRTTKGFKFSPVGDSVDITIDNSSGSGSGPGSGSGDSSDDSSGSGGGSGSGSDSSDSSLSWLGEKLAKLVGLIVDGILVFIESTLGKLLDALISLASVTIERLSKVIELFGSFANSIGAIWSWLPQDIVLVFTAGVTIFVFLAVIRFFIK